MRALEKTLPERYWVEINRLLIPFGKNICTGTLPMCSQCPVLEMCQQQDVTSHR
jgi:endonuclease-3